MVFGVLTAVGICYPGGKFTFKKVGVRRSTPLENCNLHPSKLLILGRCLNR